MAKQLFSNKFSQLSHFFMAAGLLLVMVMLVLPLPSFLLDLLLVFNIALSLIVLLVSLYVQESVEFSIFPSMLLMITLLRVGLNVACVRAILTKGSAAGKIISAFGGFVVGGNYVVGLVIFIIMVIVLFIVITNGAQRVAEVTARFTLDAMPGKQMSIDADLNAGAITEEEARQKRKDIEKEADFFGSMDGAARYIRGDAIASIVIILVSIIGGFVVGVVQQGLSLQDALRTYILLTVGMGIAFQIPALLLSTSTGIMVSRVSSEENISRDLLGQLLNHPPAFIIAAALLFFLVLIPGLPKLPILVLVASSGGIAYIMNSAGKKAEAEAKEQEEKDTLLRRKPENVMSLLKVDPIELEIGYGLIALVNPEQGGTLLDRVSLIRRQSALDLGIVVPPVRIRDNIQIAPDEYCIKIKGIEIVRRKVQLNHYLAINPGKVKETISGVPGSEPVFNLPGVWILETQRRQAETSGYTVVDIPTVISTHLSEIIKQHSSALLTRQDVQNLIDNLKKDYPAIVEELNPALLGIGDIQKVLKGCLGERVPVRDLVTICETLADTARFTKNIDALVEAVRVSLGYHICKQYLAPDKVLYTVTVDPNVEQVLLEQISSQPEGAGFSFSPEFIKTLIDRLSKALENLLHKGYQPVVLVSPQVRSVFRRLTERNFPNLAVLSYREVPSEQNVKVLGRVEL